MIKRLQIKIIAVTVGILLGVFAIVLITLNVFMHTSTTRQTLGFLTTVAENDGLMPDMHPPWGRGGGAGPRKDPLIPRRFFYAKLDAQGIIFDMDTTMMFVSTQEALSVVQSAYEKRNERDIAVNNLQYLIVEKPYGYIAVFVEKSVETYLLERLVQFSAWAVGISCGLFLALAAALSFWIVGPVRSTFEKQRQFVSDAGHELRTPLTIISANADVLEGDLGDNTWIGGIKAQVARMQGLIENLLALARSDEGGDTLSIGEFFLDRAVLTTTLEFESRAFEEKCALAYDIRPGVRYVGDEARIRQAVAILIDNAIKHTPEGGRIRVSLAQEAQRAQISVFNTGPGVPEAERDRIFERFYRSDASRSRETGGYGLGLAIAKGIAQAHRGKITVTGRAGEWIQFTITLPGAQCAG